MMGKIKTDIKYYGLECVCNLYDYRLKDFDTSVLEIEHRKSFKASKNIIDLMVIKFKKKLLTKDEHSEKTIKISLEYNEAYFLVNFIRANISFFHGILEKTMLEKFAENLNKQL